VSQHEDLGRLTGSSDSASYRLSNGDACHACHGDGGLTAAYRGQQIAGCLCQMFFDLCILTHITGLRTKPALAKTALAKTA